MTYQYLNMMIYQYLNMMIYQYLNMMIYQYLNMMIYQLPEWKLNKDETMNVPDKAEPVQT